MSLIWESAEPAWNLVLQRSGSLSRIESSAVPNVVVFARCGLTEGLDSWDFSI
jgi:hypothetical protein